MKKNKPFIFLSGFIYIYIFGSSEKFLLTIRFSYSLIGPLVDATMEDYIYVSSDDDYDYVDDVDDVGGEFNDDFQYSEFAETTAGPVSKSPNVKVRRVLILTESDRLFFFFFALNVSVLVLYCLFGCLENFSVVSIFTRILRSLTPLGNALISL